MKNQFKLWGTAVLIFYVVCFAFLVIHNFQVWTLSPFVESIIGVFMGAGAIAIITGIIIIFQSSIQAEQEKKQEVFKQKLELYKKIIDQLQQAFKVQDNEKISTITEGEKLELFFTQLNIGLLSKPKTFKSFSKLINEVAEEDGKLKEGASKLLLDFIIDARDDLDVQDDKEKMTDQDKKYLADAIKIAEKQATKAFQKTFYNDFEDYLKNNPNVTNVGEQRVQLLREIHNLIIKAFANIKISYSKRNLNFGIMPPGRKKKTLLIIETQVKKHLRLLTLAPQSDIPEEIFIGNDNNYNVVKINDISDYIAIEKVIERSYNIVLNNEPKFKNKLSN